MNRDQTMIILLAEHLRRIALCPDAAQKMNARVSIASLLAHVMDVNTCGYIPTTDCGNKRRRIS